MAINKDTKRTSTKDAAKEVGVRISRDQIRARAYEVYMARSGGPGDAMSDWLQAEGELRQGIVVATTREPLTAPQAPLPLHKTAKSTKAL